MKLRPLTDVASELGLDPAHMLPWGRDRAKIDLAALEGRSPRGRLVLVSAVTPTPAGEGNALNPGTIHGVPVFVTSAMPAMTAGLKSVLVTNPDFYGLAEREGMTVQRNPYLYQANGQIGLFAKFRLGGAVLQAEAHYYLTQHA